MALRIRCRCGKALKISSKLAGKTVQCPACHAPFSISAERFRAAESLSKSPPVSGDTPSSTPKSQNDAIPLADDSPPPRPVIELETNPEPAALDDMLFADAHSQSDILDLKPTLELESTPLPATPVTDEPTFDVGYARDTAKAEGATRFNTVIAPQRPFKEDALLAFSYPVMNTDNAVRYGVMCISLAVPYAFFQLVAIPCLGLLVGGLLMCWIMSVFLNVISETGRGSDDLPTDTFSGGMYDSFLAPALNFIGAFALVLAPWVALIITGYLGLLPKFFLQLAPVWMSAGIFLFPMSLMLFAFEAPSVLLRPQLVISTIASTFLPYLAIWGLLLIVSAIWSVVFASNLIVSYLPGLSGLNTLATYFNSPVGAVLALFFEIYVMLVAMRLVGLYYLHFKKRFAFQME